MCHSKNVINFILYITTAGLLNWRIKNLKGLPELGRWEFAPCPSINRKKKCINISITIFFGIYVFKTCIILDNRTFSFKEKYRFLEGKRPVIMGTKFNTLATIILINMSDSFTSEGFIYHVRRAQGW